MTDKEGGEASRSRSVRRDAAGRRTRPTRRPTLLAIVESAQKEQPVRSAAMWRKKSRAISSRESSASRSRRPARCAGTPDPGEVWRQGPHAGWVDGGAVEGLGAHGARSKKKKLRIPCWGGRVEPWTGFVRRNCGWTSG